MKKVVLESGSALLITDRLSRKYFSGVDVAEGVVVIKDGVTVLTDSRYFYAVEKECNEVGVDCKLYVGFESIKELLVDMHVDNLYIDYNVTTLREYEQYKTFGIKLSDGANLIENARAIKTKEELDNIRKACQIIEKAYHSAIKQVRLGMSELELKNIIDNYAVEFGAEGSSFDTIVAFGENSAIPHHETGETLLTNNSVILIDTGCKVNGYCSDLTRTAFFGSPSKKFLDCYQAVLKANLIAEENIKDGTTCKQADAFARDHLKQHDLDVFFTHSLGHGLGLEVHEYPRLSPKGEGVLKNNIAFTVEPGVYFNGEFGIRIEDTVALIDGKLERMFSDDKKLIIL